MAMPKIQFPSTQYLLNILLAMLILSFVFRTFVPENFKQYFRI